MTVHTVKAYDAELEIIGGKIAEMGGVAERMLTNAMAALVRLDVELARTVVESDPRLGELQRELEEQAVLTIARRQPMAVDLRELVRDLPTLLADVGEFMTLQPGDVLMVGTDCLTDGTHPRAKAGDRVEISAPGLSSVTAHVKGQA